VEADSRQRSSAAGNQRVDGCRSPDLFLRTADAVHLATAQQIGESDVWTNDRHMLAAAPYFGLRGRSF